MTREAWIEPEFSLRAARPEDYPFALGLFVDGSAEHLKKIGRWDEGRVVGRFRRAYKHANARIICAEGKDVGWIQIDEFVRRLHLRQLHLIARVRGRGIGTRLIEDLHERGVRLGKPVTLEVIHGNPAKSLYLRLGFRPRGEDLDKAHMIWRLPRKSKPEARRTRSAPDDEG
jgi:GNAT superfamily N-acetyltransferase